MRSPNKRKVTLLCTGSVVFSQMMWGQYIQKTEGHLNKFIRDYMTVRVRRSFPDAALSAQLLLSCKEVQPWSSPSWFSSYDPMLF